MKSFTIALTLFFCLADTGFSQPAKNPKEPVLKLKNRHGYTADLKHYPQATPRDTLESILKALIAERMEYVLAHLADPAYVDEKVDRYVQESARKEELASTAFAGRLGANVSLPDEQILKNFNLQDRGLVIEKIRAGSPAARAGFKEQDIILAIDLNIVPTLPAQFVRMLGEFKEGVALNAKVLRKGRPIDLANLVLPEYEDPNRRLAFRKLAEETLNLYFEDAGRVQELRKFAREGEWKIEDNRAIGTLKQLGTYRQVFLRLDEDRWFLENRQKER